MEIRKTRRINKTEEYTEKILCDICNEEIHEGIYETKDINIYARIGSSYPEGGSGTETRIDCCENCFLDKVVPLLEKEFNLKFTQKEYDF